MKYVSRRTPVSALLLSLALGLCGSAAARDQEPSRARKTPQAASKAAPKVKPQPAPAPRALPRQSASAEARLLEIYRLIGSAQADVALVRANLAERGFHLQAPPLPLAPVKIARIDGRDD